MKTLIFTSELVVSTGTTCWGKAEVRLHLYIDIYDQHLKEIQEEISHAKVCMINMHGPFKDKKCLLLEPKNPTKISDIGCVLAYLSAQEGLLNLSIMTAPKKQDDVVRVSCRSHRSKDDPKALEFAKIFGGGGHLQAAGFKINKAQMKCWFKMLGQNTMKTSLKLSDK